VPRRILVVTTAPDPEDELRERVRLHEGGDAEVLVVAPASDLSFLQWIASDEDRARAEAEQRARKVAELVGAKEARVGDPDPVIAIEDALRTFPADEVIVVTRPRDAATWLEKDLLNELGKHFGLPVSHIVDDDAFREAMPAR